MQLQPNGLFPAIDPTIRLADLIGSGSSATVFRAQRMTANDTEMVAVKIAQPHVSLADEIRALKRFTHPNIVRLIDDRVSGVYADGATSIVLELCDGGTVEDLLRRRALTVGEVHMVVSSIGAALCSIHDSGWIHGDINPSNIAFRSTGPACLIDFGACRPASDELSEVGTDGFTAAQLASSPTLDVRALAATALAGFGPPAAVAAADKEIVDQVSKILAGCDRGETVSLDVLLKAFDGRPIENPIIATSAGRPRLDGSGPGARRPNRTRRFGPRPGPTPTAAPGPEPRRRPSRQLLALFALVLAIGLIGLDLIDSPATAVASDSILEEGPLPGGAETLTAEATLELVHATWSQREETMALHRTETNDTFTAGNPGDEAAIGDWNCDGTATLGIFRPSSGAWFTFDGWQSSSISTIDTSAARQTGDLSIHIDPAGCARPVFA